eukprot:4995228-Prymnesium_polylepis.1
MSYTKHFVWNALPEERALLAAASRESVGAAWSSSSHFTGCMYVPPNAGSLLRLTPGLDGDNL